MALKRLIGTDPDQVPLNQMLGDLAYQSSAGAALTQVGIGTGTATAPSIFPIGQTDTGIWFPNSTNIGVISNVAVSTSGVERLRINNLGNVGIGTTSVVSGNAVSIYGGNLFVNGFIYGTANTALNASNVVVTATSTNATFYPAFVEATSGNLGIRVDSNLSYNPATDALSLQGNILIQNGGRFGNIAITNTTAATSSSTGALIVSGGVGVVGNIIISNGNIGVGTSTAVGGNAVSIYGGNLFIAGNLRVGNTATAIGGIRFSDGTFQSTAAATTQTNVAAFSASNITVTATSTDSTFYVAFFEGTTANIGARVNNSFTYNPAKNTISLGNIVSSKWEGQVIAAAYGGTGMSSYVQGDLLYASSATTLSALNPVGAGVGPGNVLVNGVSGPSWGAVDLSSASAVKNTLGVAYGGSGTGTQFTQGSVVFAGASGVYAQDNSVFFWDDSNNRLGLGTASPSQTLDVNGSALIRSNIQVLGNIAVNNSALVGNLSITNTTAATSSTTGALIVRGGVGIGGNLYVGGNLIINGNVTYINTNVTVIEDPSVTIGTGPNGAPLTVSDSYDRGVEFHYYSGGGDRYGFLGWQNSSGKLTYITNATAGSTTGIYTGVFGDAQLGNLVLGGAAGTSTNATSTSTGALIISGTGGIGVGGNIYVGGTIFGAVNTAINASNVVITATSTNATFYPAFVEATSGNLGIRTDAGITYNPSTDALSLTGNLLIQNGGRFGNINVTNTTAATSATTGALIVAGGVGIVGNLFVGGSINGANVNVTGANAPPNGIWLPTTNILGFSTGSSERRRIVAIGNVAIGGTSTSNATMTITGNAQASTSSTMELFPPSGTGGSVSLLTKLRFRSTFDAFPSDQGPRTTSQIVTGFNGGIWGSEYMAFGVGYLSGSPNDAAVNPTERMRITITGVGIGTTSPSQTLDVNGSVLMRSNVQIAGNLFTSASAWTGNLSVTNTTTSTSSTSGALLVAGGVGITGNAFVSNSIWAGNLSVTNTTASTSATTGALIVAGGIGITGNITVGNAGRFGNISVTNTTASTSATTGALIVAGGVGIVGNLFTSASAWTGNLAITNTTTSTSATTGAVLVAGGVGIVGNLFVGGSINGANVNVTSANAPPNGIWLPGTNILGFSTGSSEKMRLTPNGNLLLGGTSESGFRLEVTNQNLGTAANSRILGGRFTTSNSNSDFLEIMNVRNQAGGPDWPSAGWRLQQKIDATWMGYIQFNGTSSNVGVGTTNSFGITFGAGSSTADPNGVPEVMRITSAGRVGIGTAVPSTPLHVMGNIRISNTTVIGGVVFADGTFQNTAATTILVPSGVNSASNVTVTATSTNTTFYPAFVESTSGNIGIRVDSGLTYNPLTEALSLTGNLLIQNGGRFGNINVTNTTASTSATTGALIVAGGIGVVGNVVAGNSIWSGNLSVINAAASTTTATGAILVPLGGVGIAGNITVGNAGRFGNIYVNNTTASTSATTGALLAAGGVGIGGNLYVNNTAVFGNSAMGSLPLFWTTNTTNYPPTGFTGSLGFNFSSGNGEVDFWNNYTPAAQSFRFYQQLSASTSSVVLQITSGGTGTFLGGLTATNANVTGSTAPANGMFLAAASSLGFSTGSSERMRINASGNVGIGTSSPSQTLDVNGSVLMRSNVQIAGNITVGNAGRFGNISVANTTQSTSTATGAVVNLGGEGIAGNLFVGGSINGANINVTSANAPPNGIWLPATNSLGFATASAERARFDQYGNLSIGTSAVGYGFGSRTSITVNGTSQSLLALYTGNTNRAYFYNDGTNTNLFADTAGGALTIGTSSANPLIFYAGNSERVRIDANGNAMVGTSSTTAKLAVVAANGTHNAPVVYASDSSTATVAVLSLSATSSVNGVGIAMYGPGATTPNKFIRVVSGQLQVINSAYSTSILTLTDDGILTTAQGVSVSATPSTGGQIRMISGSYGAFWRNDGSNIYLLFTASGDQSGTWNTLRPFYASVTTGAVTLGNGLSVLGAITATSDITAYSSDSRLKTNVSVITNAIDKLSGLKGVMFDWRDDVADLGFTPSRMHDVGVLAQDVQAVLPEAVRPAPFDLNDEKTSKSGENYLTVQYEKLTALLIEAVKEQQKMITRHEDRIAALESAINGGTTAC